MKIIYNNLKMENCFRAAILIIDMLWQERVCRQREICKVAEDFGVLEKGDY